MANVVKLPVRTATSSVDPPQNTLREFQDTLNPENLTHFRTINTKPDAAAVISFTTHLDQVNAQRRKHYIASRLFTVLESVSVPHKANNQVQIKANPNQS